MGRRIPNEGAFMKKSNKLWINVGFQLLAIVLAIAFTSLILVMAGAHPFEVYFTMLKGSLSSISRFTDVLVAWIPLLLAASGLLVTFSAGLWNIGVEGQITLGAIFTTGVLRYFQNTSLSPVLIITLAILGGMLGGALWAMLAGILKTFGGVSEIFGGLGLNFVATSINIWMIFGPWKRPGVGSMSGTQPFPETLWLSMFQGSRLSATSLVIGIIGLIIVIILLGGTYLGLRLKAVGYNPRSAFRLGIPTWQHMLLAFAICGMFAGAAGAVQVTGVYHRLIPAISSGYGFLGLLVGMLINYQALWVAPVAFFFAVLNIGSIQLPIVFKMDASLAGVIQGMLVLFVLAMDGVRQRFLKKSGG
jgi:general nucleoside transport system permease protein